MNLESSVSSFDPINCILKFWQFFFVFYKNSVNIFILGLHYLGFFFPYFLPRYILHIIFVDSEESWSGRSLKEYVIYSREVIPNLFQ